MTRCSVIKKTVGFSKKQGGYQLTLSPGFLVSFVWPKFYFQFKVLPDNEPPDLRAVEP